MNKIQEEVKASEQYNLECEELSDGITLVKLTKDNVAKVESIIRTDSNYSSFKEANYDNEKYSPYWIREMGKHLGQITDEEKKETDFEKIVENVIEKIDKENGTHLMADCEKDEKGTIKKSARDFMKDKIITCNENKTLLKYLKEPDFSKENLISILSAQTEFETGKGRRHLSFASKFCHYSCYHLFSGEKEQDNYSIYDRYVREALPFYLEKYEINNIKITNKSTYKEYQQAIDAILDKADDKISRNGFDHLIWYYFKGDRIKNEKNSKKNKLKK